ncbi:MbnP family copper-binding protein [Tepidicella baoligensis]|uniref:MbnP family copper-binding protein n=1 Tax=Tepidicella baoligensis TaxID=2707016 RepID=UPI001C5C89C4|nr:MbnP family copper-binding protein [Tepidicella baoligensis]
MKTLLTLSVAACAVCLAACSSTPPQATTLSVAIPFAAEINGQPFACGQQYGPIGTTASTITPMDFRFYVSNVKLIDEQGRAVPVQLTQDGMWQLGALALLDFENGQGPCRNGTPAVNTTVRGTVPAGNYQGIEFTLGVPFEQNHGDPTTAPAPLNSTAMFWNWQGGYKFLKFDTTSAGLSPEKPGAPSPQGPVTRYAVHLGSTGCTSAGRTVAPATPCANPNTVTVRFDRFDLSKQTIVADMGRILAGANVDVNAPQTSPGCMSFSNDADCPPVMAALGLAYDGTPAPAAGQQLFSVR